MDPNTFALKWDQVFEALAALVVFSMLIERCFSLVFENKQFLAYISSPDHPNASGLRELLVFVTCVAFCWYWKFDLPSIIMSAPQTGVPGYIITGGVIAGGSKGSIKLFRDILGFKSGAYKDYEEGKKNPPDPKKPKPDPDPDPKPKDNGGG